MSSETYAEKSVSNRKCVTCGGRGRVQDPDHTIGNLCGTCKGSGIQRVTVDETGKYWLNPGELHGECPSCGGVGVVCDPQHGASQKCEPCRGRGLIPHQLCEVHQCQRRVLPDRKICENHAFPAARPPETTGRRAAVLATKKKLAEEAKVSEDITDGSE